MTSKAYLVIFTVGVCAFFQTAEAIDCYQCISTNNSHPFQCNEFLTSDIDMQPEPCTAVYAAQYCVKHIGRFEGGIGTKRYCSAVHMGNYCEYVQQPGDRLTYRTCVFTCTGDGCNPASSVRSTVSVGVLIIGSFLISEKLLLQR